jgi:hypothetical protein
MHPGRYRPLCSFFGGLECFGAGAGFDFGAGFDCGAGFELFCGVLAWLSFAGVVFAGRSACVAGVDGLFPALFSAGAPARASFGDMAGA